MASLLVDSVARRAAVVACVGQIVITSIFLLPHAQLQDQCATAAEAASLHAYPIYLLLSIVATELMVTVGMVWRRLCRREFFLLVLALYVVIAYHFGWYLCFLFVKTMGRFSCFGVLGKAAIVVGSVVLFAPMWMNILHCFLAVFPGY